jgi:hypothetical protein
MVGMVLFLPESWTTRLGLMRQRIVAARAIELSSSPSRCPPRLRSPDASNAVCGAVGYRIRAGASLA